MSTAHDKPDAGAEPPRGDRVAARAERAPAAGSSMNLTVLGLPAGYAKLAWAAALLGVVAALVGRALAPALAGVWVGTDHLIPKVDLGAAIGAQLFAIVTMTLLMSAIVALSRTSWPMLYRGSAVGVAGLVAMAVASSIFIMLPEVSRLAAGTGAGALAVIAGLYGLRVPRARWAAIALAAVGLAGLTRMVSMAALHFSGADIPRSVRIAATVGATASFVLEAFALLIALGWLAGVRFGPRQLANGLLLLVMAAAIVTIGVRGALPDASGTSVLINRALGLLMLQPDPWVPNVLRGYVEALGWVLAAAALGGPGGTRLVPAIMAFTLLGRGTLETPLCSAAVVLAALLLALVPYEAARHLPVERALVR
jgi:hypothetical protein